MLSLALASLRGRWPALTGAFVALAVGAALSIAAFAVMMSFQRVGVEDPQRYRATPIVVAHAPSVSVTTGTGEDREVSKEHVSTRAALDPTLPERVAAAPGVRRTVVDRAFTVRIPGSGEGTVGHPWSARALTPYRLVAGRAPVAGDEIAATAGGPVAPSGKRAVELGAAITLATPEGPTRYRVVALVKPQKRGPAYERPLFFIDVEAARLAPQITAIGVWPRAAAPAVRRVVGGNPGVVALMGDRRAELEPSAERDAAEAGSVLLGMMAMTVGFVAVFVIASTFAFAAALRRRELGLLRAIGATPRQVRRLVMREAALLACAAGIVGAIGSLAVAPAAGRWLADRGMAPTGMHVLPSLPAMAIGGSGMVLVALVGAWLAARRAARVRPAEALRDAAVDRGVMNPLRWAVGVLSLGGGVAVMLQPVPDDPAGALGLALAESALLIVGLTMLAPVVVPSLVALLVAPFARGRGAGPMLVREQARVAVRRTTSTAAPVLVVVGLAAAMSTMVATIADSDRAAVRERFAPDAMRVSAPDGGPLSEADVAALAAVPGAQVGATLDASVLARDSMDLLLYGATGVDPGARRLVLRTPTMRGSTAKLTGDAVALGEMTASGMHKRVGNHVRVWFPDGTRSRPLRVTAILADGFSSTSVYLPRQLLAAHAGAAATAAYVRLPRNDAGAERALRAAAGARGLTVRAATGPQRVADVTDSSNMNGRALQVILGVAIIYAVIALASTAAVGTVASAGELARLRLSGATPGQVMRLVAAETMVATGAGALLGLAAALAVFLGLRRGFADLHGPAPVTMPWVTLIMLAAGCAVVAASAAALAARRSQAAPPYALAGAAGT